MPLRDHFSKLTDQRNWGPVHGTWPAIVAITLNRTLPEQFVAHPEVDIGAMEIDLAAFESTPDSGKPRRKKDDGALALAESMTVLETNLKTWDDFEVLFYHDEAGKHTLVAALEFVSPSNKDRPDHRKQFLRKCLQHLKNNVSLGIVDIVTRRHVNLWGELQNRLKCRRTEVSHADLYAISCRCVPKKKRRDIQAWEHTLTVGGNLPTIPLWLTEDFYVLVDLEATYEETCRSLRIK